MSKKEEIDLESFEEELIPFVTKNEDWQVYELEDDTIIRTKFVLMTIIAYGEPNEKGLRLSRFGSQTLTVIYSPKDIRGPPDKTWTAEELEPFIIEKNLKFRQIHDAGIYQYKTEKSQFEVDYRIFQVDKTDKYDILGNPAYIVRTKGTMAGTSEDEDELIIKKEELKSPA